jgi:hypothetical protein
MARFLFVLALTAIASGFAVQATPWWVAMPIAFLVVLVLPMRGGRSFLATGLGVALSFFILSFMTDSANEHILSGRMAALFHLPSYVFMLVLTTLVGFVTGGLGGWTAALFRNLFRKPASTEEQFVSKQSAS